MILDKPDISRIIEMCWEDRTPFEAIMQLYSLSEKEIETGNSLLKKLGVNQDDWFVTLHVRESEDNHSYLRDADPSTYTEAIKKIVDVLDTKIRPAVARDGGDIKFEEFKNGVVKVKLQGSCSGCPSSTMTLKQGVQNLLCHYISDVKEVIAI